MIHINKGFIPAILLLLISITLPLWAGGFLTNASILFLLYISIAEFWSFMAKHARIVSLGQQMFIGVGGYSTAVLCMYFGLQLWVSVLIAGLIGCGLACLLSFPLLRLRGFYFAIGTMLASEVIKLIFTGWEFVGAGMGLIFRNAYGIAASIIYYPALILALLSIFLIYYLYHSKLGFGLRALGEDEDASSALGISSFKCKALCFILASLIASYAGAIYAVFHPYLEPVSAFHILWTTSLVFISVIGGVGTITGPVVGSAIYVALIYVLSQYIGLSLLLQGIIVLVFLMVFPQGLWGFVATKLKLKFKPPV
ncbi:MAG: branched-chain amino acid ABC transporter permease [Candidatus Bathyarchaeia archaeon]